MMTRSQKSLSERLVRPIQRAFDRRGIVTFPAIQTKALSRLRKALFWAVSRIVIIDARQTKLLRTSQIGL
jgi:hypothetical protein